MRCAVFVATAHGIELAGKLRQELEGTVDIFVKEGRDVPGKAYRYERLGDTVRTLFTQYDALIFCMAVGIVVRLIAPCLKSKLTDPAVVVVDERAHYAISLLSGHVGGANRLTERVAAILGAVSVITTATDVNHYLAPDALATALGLRPVPKPEIQTINGALLEEKTVAWYIDPRLRRAAFYQKRLAEKKIDVRLLSANEILRREGMKVFVTDSPILKTPGLLNLVPRRLAAGIGCRRGVPAALIRGALEAACTRIGQDINAVSMLASTVVKKDEAGILEVAKALNVEACFYENEALEEKITEYHLAESAFVKRTIGVGNISEAAALCAVKEGRVALAKTKFTKVTVALVWEK